MPIDLSQYPKDWKARSKFVIHIRARNRCEWCGAENGKPHPVTGSKVVLTTAHLWHDKGRSSLLDLAALCQRCHLDHDKFHHQENRRFGRNWKRNQLALFDVSRYYDPMKRRRGK